MDIFFIVLVFVFGFVFGWLRATRSILDRMTQDTDSLIKILNAYKDAKKKAESPEQEVSRKLKVERHGDMLYVFAEDTDEFLAQGKTLQEALAVIEKRFPNKTFIGHLNKEQADKLGITTN